MVMFIIQEQPVHRDVLIGGDQIDISQFESVGQIEEFANCSISVTSSSDDVSSTDDNESTVVGSPVDRSYTIQDTSMSEVEVSFVNPSYSPIRLSDDDCASPQQAEEVNSTSEEISADQQNATNPTLDSLPANDITIPLPQFHWSGFKIVIDNIDKNFRPSYQRVDHQTKSLHCVHMFASKDRIDLSSFSDSKPQEVSVTPKDILPSSCEFSDVKEHFKVLVSRLVFGHDRITVIL